MRSCVSEHKTERYLYFLPVVEVMEDYQWYIPWPQRSTSLLSSSQLGSSTAGPRSPETTEILYAVLPSGDFMRCFAREITFVACVCFPMHQTPSEKGSTLKEKNLLLRSPLFHKEGKTVISPESVSIPLNSLHAG